MSALQQTRCLNCGSEDQGSYCSECGQRNSGSGLSFKGLVTEVFSTVFNLETPLLGTFLGLIRSPGQVVRSYIAGQRKSYYKPVPFLILAVAILFFIRYLFDHDPIEAMIQSAGGEDRMFPAQRAASYWMARNVNFILPVWILILSLVYPLFFRGKEFNLTERIAIFLFFVGEYVLLSLVSIPLTKLSPFLMVTIYPIMVGYLTYAIADLVGIKFWTVVKALLLVLISFVGYVVLANSVLIWYFTRFPQEISSL